MREREQNEFDGVGYSYASFLACHVMPITDGRSNVLAAYVGGVRRFTWTVKKESKHIVGSGREAEWAAKLLHDMYQDFVASNEDVKFDLTSFNTSLKAWVIKSNIY